MDDAAALPTPRLALPGRLDLYYGGGVVHGASSQTSRALYAVGARLS